MRWVDRCTAAQRRTGSYRFIGDIAIAGSLHEIAVQQLDAARQLVISLMVRAQDAEPLGVVKVPFVVLVTRGHHNLVTRGALLGYRWCAPSLQQGRSNTSIVWLC